MKNNLLTKNKVSIGIIVIYALTMLGNSYIQHIKINTPEQIAIVAASTEIREGTELTDKVLKVINVDLSSVDEGSVFKSTGELAGYSALTPMYPEEPIRKQRIYPSSEPKNEDYAFQLNTLDRALDIRKGSFIDIWRIPTVKGMSLGLKPDILIASHYVNDVKNENLKSIKEESSKSTEAEKKDEGQGSRIPAILILNMRGIDIQTLSSTDPNLYSHRVTLHKRANYYKSLVEKSTTPEQSLSEIKLEKEDRADKAIEERLKDEERSDADKVDIDTTKQEDKSTAEDQTIKVPDIKQTLIDPPKSETTKDGKDQLDEYEKEINKTFKSQN